MALSCLIVDDNVSFLKAAGALLERDGITVVAVATNSAEALRRARELQPDVLLVDIELGHESGLDLTHRLMTTATTPGAQVILMSVHREDDFGGLIDASPALGFLAKARLSGGAIRRLLGDGQGGSG
ncbi:response regulator transcription factor [Actinoallomurus acaciae]|uniref:Response regulator transcription factor n=2 Tax=Actinoallomurus acaciae TaxID=502577 RepID=A0ABV5YF99_9ACTN